MRNSSLVLLFFICAFCLENCNNQGKIGEVKGTDSVATKISNNPISNPSRNESDSIPFATKAFEDSLRNLYPFFTKENCARYVPDVFFKKMLTIYGHGKATDEPGNFESDFSCEVCKDGEYMNYAMLLRKYNDSTLKQTNVSALRKLLRSYFVAINDAFDCISDGGTMYGHMYSRIPAFIEWDLADGFNNRFKVDNVPNEKHLNDEFLKIAHSYHLEKSDSALMDCLPSYDTDYNASITSWIRYRASLFMNQYK